MKKYSKQLLSVMAGVAAGAAIRSLIVANKKKRSDKVQGNSWMDKCGKEKLQKIKDKFEMHKLRLEKKLQMINTRLAQIES